MYQSDKSVEEAFDKEFCVVLKGEGGWLEKGKEYLAIEKKHIISFLLTQRKKDREALAELISKQKIEYPIKNSRNYSKQQYFDGGYEQALYESSSLIRTAGSDDAHH